MGHIANKLLALNSAKHAIREAINDKGGILQPGDPLSAYPDAVRNIKSLSEEDMLRANLVLLTDWDFKTHDELYANDGDSVKLPSLPSDDYLEFLGWSTRAANAQLILPGNLTVNEDMHLNAVFKAKAVNGFAVAYLYGLSAGETVKLKVDWASLTKPESTYSSTFTVDWGDGTTSDYEIRGGSTTAVTPQHTYSAAGDYVIQVKHANDGTYFLYLDGGFTFTLANCKYKLFNEYRNYASNSAVKYCVGMGIGRNPTNFSSGQSAYYNSSCYGGFLTTSSYTSRRDVFNNSPITQPVLYNSPFGCGKIYKGLTASYAKRITLTGSASGVTDNWGSPDVLTIDYAGNIGLFVDASTTVKKMFRTRLVKFRKNAKITVSGNISDSASTYFANMINLKEFFEHFAETSTTRTITLKLPWADCLEYAKILTPKGYTVVISS